MKTDKRVNATAMRSESTRIPDMPASTGVKQEEAARSGRANRFSVGSSRELSGISQVSALREALLRSPRWGVAPIGEPQNRAAECDDWPNWPNWRNF